MTRSPAPRAQRDDPVPAAGRRIRYAGLGYALTVLLTGTNLATPLYAVYEHVFGLSPLDVTLLVAVYATAVVVGPADLRPAQRHGRLPPGPGRRAGRGGLRLGPAGRGDGTRLVVRGPGGAGTGRGHVLRGAHGRAGADRTTRAAGPRVVPGRDGDHRGRRVRPGAGRGARAVRPRPAGAQLPGRDRAAGPGRWPRRSCCPARWAGRGSDGSPGGRASRRRSAPRSWFRPW